MDTSTTLEEQIQALMDSLADTALSAAESRHQSQAGEAPNTGGDIDFASSKTRLPNGDSSCVAYRKDGIVEVVAHADSGKLGLYRKSDGKPLQPVGEE